MAELDYSEGEESGTPEYPVGTKGFVSLRIAQYALITLVGIITARALGPDGRAEYIIPLTVAGIVWGISHLSLSEAAGRLIGRGLATPKQAAQALVAATVVLSLASFGLYMLLFLAFGPRLFADASSLAILLAGLSIPPTMAASFASDLLVRIGALLDSGVGVLIGSALQILAIVGAWIFGVLTPALVIGTAVASLLVSAGFMGWRLNRRLGGQALRARAIREVLGRAIRIGAVLHPGALSLQLGSRIDLVVVGVIFSVTETGLYSLSIVLADSVFLLCRTLAELALPAQTQADERTAVTHTDAVVRLSLKLSVLSAIAGGVGGWLLIPVVFGEEWEGAIWPLFALLAAAGAFAIVNPIRTLLARTYRPRRLSELAVGMLVINVTGTVILGLAFGLVGAAAASTIAYWLYAGALLWVMRSTVANP